MRAAASIARAVDHAIKIGGKVDWMPTLAATNHIRKELTEAKSFPKTAQKMLDRHR